MKRTTTSRKSLTKFPKLRKLSDVDIVRDRDAPEWTPEMFARAVARRGLKPVPSERLRAQGLRPVQIWVPDVRARSFINAARKQSRAVALSKRATVDQRFINAVSEDFDA